MEHEGAISAPKPEAFANCEKPGKGLTAVSSKLESSAMAWERKDGPWLFLNPGDPALKPKTVLFLVLASLTDLK